MCAPDAGKNWLWQINKPCCSSIKLLAICWLSWATWSSEPRRWLWLHNSNWDHPNKDDVCHAPSIDMSFLKMNNWLCPSLCASVFCRVSCLQFNSNFILVLSLCGPLSLPLFLLPPSCLSLHYHRKSGCTSNLVHRTSCTPSQHHRWVCPVTVDWNIVATVEQNDHVNMLHTNSAVWIQKHYEWFWLKRSWSVQFYWATFCIRDSFWLASTKYCDFIFSCVFTKKIKSLDVLW